MENVSDHIGALCGLSMCYRALGDFQLSEELLDQGMRLSGAQYWLLVERALLEQQRYRLDAALGFCDKAIALEPATGAAYMWKHTLLTSLGRENEQVVNREVARKNVPAFIEIQNHFYNPVAREATPDAADNTAIKRAANLRTQGCISEAIECLRTRFYEYPVDVASCIQLIEILCSNQEIEEAACTLKEALLRNPNNEWLLLEEPGILAASGRIEDSKRLYLNLADRYPLNSLPLLRLVEQAFDEKQFDEAQGYAQRVLKVDDKNFLALTFLSKILRESGDIEGSIAAAEVIQKYYPYDHNAYLFLAECVKHRGDIEGALSYLLRGLELANDKMEILHAILHNRMKVHDFDEAFLVIEEYSDVFLELCSDRQGVFLDVFRIGTRISPTLESHTRLLNLLLKASESSHKPELSVYLFVTQTLFDIMRLPIGSDVWMSWTERDLVLERIFRSSGSLLAKTIAEASAFFPHMSGEIQGRLKGNLLPFLRKCLMNSCVSKGTIILLIFYRDCFTSSEILDLTGKFATVFSEITVNEWIDALHHTDINSYTPDKQLSRILKKFRNILGVKGTTDSILIKLILSSIVAGDVCDAILELAIEEVTSDSFYSELDKSTPAQVIKEVNLINFFWASRSDSDPVPELLMV